jgi:hypothetical protein
MLGRAGLRANGRVPLGERPPRRTLLKGGFRYQVYLPGAHGLAQFSIQHLAAGCYGLSTSYVDDRARPILDLPAPCRWESYLALS